MATFLVLSAGQLLASKHIAAGKLVPWDYSPMRIPSQIFLPAVAPGRAHARQSGAGHVLYPILVFLHGAGDGPFHVMNRQSLPSLLLNNESFAATFPFVAIFPCSTCGGPPGGWLSTNFEKVDMLIDLVVRWHHGDPERVILTGQSMGGGGLWKYAAARPGKFAALVPVCAALSPSPSLAKAACCTDGACCPSTWVFHGANDGSVPVSLSDKWVDALRSINREVRYTRYEWAPPPPMVEFQMMTGHASYELAYRDEQLYEWMLRQRRCTSCAATMPSTTPL